MTTEQATPPATDRGNQPSASLRGVIVFVAIAYLLGWLFALPAWFTGGLSSPLFGVSATAMMFSPMIAALVVTRWVERRRWRSADDQVGIAARLGIPIGRPIGGFLGWLAVAWAGLLVLTALAFVTSWLLGVWQPDVKNFSALAAQLAQLGVPEGVVPLPVVAVSQLVQAVTLGVAINCLATVGEEVGWRGFLYPALLSRLPRVAALLVGGVIWGLWHAPVILLGYNYGRPFLGLVMMCGFTTLYGIVLAWLRVRSGTVWPAVVGHAVINSASSAGLLILGDINHPPNTLLATPLGLVGWIVPVIVVVALVWRGQWRVRPPRRPRRTAG